MSVDDPNGTSRPAPGSLPTAPTASYMGCRHCEEGNLVYDRDAGASRCRCCGELD